MGSALHQSAIEHMALRFPAIRSEAVRLPGIGLQIVLHGVTPKSTIVANETNYARGWTAMNVHARELADGFDLEHLTPEFYANPYPTYRALRETEPVKRMRNGSYFLTRYDDLVTAYKNTRAYSSDKKKEFAPKYGDTPLYEHHTTSLVFNDPPAHTRVRRLIMGALSPRAIAEMEGDLIRLVDMLLDRIAG